VFYGEDRYFSELGLSVWASEVISNKGRAPAPEDGVTVFLQGLENRGPDNHRKRIYMSAVTPDLYGPNYQEKAVTFFDIRFSTISMREGRLCGTISTIILTYIGIFTSA
jgi:hypothetical protein